MSASSARGHYANPPLEDEDDLIDPDDGKRPFTILNRTSLRSMSSCTVQAVGLTLA